MSHRLARLRVCILTLACLAVVCLALAAPAHAQSTPVLTATSVSHSQINLAWTSAGAGYTYDLFRRTTGSETEIAMNQTGLTFSDTGLGSSTPYFYKVTVVGGTGPTSAEKEAVTSPSGVAATPGDANVGLTWNGPSPSYVTYSVSRSPGGSLATGLTTASYTDTTALNETAYTYQITATSSDAGKVASIPSPPTAIVTPALQINAGGPGLTSAGQTSGGVIAWGADNGLPSPGSCW